MNHFCIGLVHCLAGSPQPFSLLILKMMRGISIVRRFLRWSVVVIHAYAHALAIERASLLVSLNSSFISSSLKTFRSKVSKRSIGFVLCHDRRLPPLGKHSATSFQGGRYSTSRLSSSWDSRSPRGTCSLSFSNTSLIVSGMSCCAG